MSRQTRHGSTENSHKSEEFFWKVARFFPLLSMFMPFPTRCPLKTSSHNQQKSPKKWEILDFEEYALWANRTAKRRIGNLSTSPCLRSRNEGEPSGIIRETNIKTLLFSINVFTYESAF